MPAFMELYTAGLSRVMQPEILLLIFGGTFMGITFGALPGLTANMAVAILVPLTYALSPEAGILTLIGVYMGAVYGGSISATLINVPGTPAAVMTTMDAYPMAQRGEAGRALGLATVSSFLGGMISVIFLALFAPLVAGFALQFQSLDFFALALLGVSIMAYISEGSMLKGLISGVLGLFLATVGLDSMSAVPRFTFGRPELIEGVHFISAIIGLYGLAEMLDQLNEGGGVAEVVRQKLTGIIPSARELWRLMGVIFRSSLVGVLVGAIPGTGATIASIVSYGQQKRFSRNPEQMGKGAPEGIVASEAANNACTGGALATMLSLGIPGDSVTAILIGAFLLHGLRPGPLLFTEHIPEVSSVFIGSALANVAMLVIGLAGARFFARVIMTPKQVLIPVIMALMVIGSYGIRNSAFDVGVMLFFGILGWVMINLKIPRGPLVLALILGEMLESNLRRSIQLHGNQVGATLWDLVSRPLSGIIVLITVLLLVAPYIRRRKSDSAKEAA